MHTALLRNWEKSETKGPVSVSPNFKLVSEFET